MLGDFTDLVAVAAAAVAIGILEQGVLYTSPDELVAPVLGGVIIVAMLVRRLARDRLGRRPRGSPPASSSWRSASRSPS